MPPTVRAVSDLPGLHLRRLAGPDGADRLVRWVAVSELEDPRPYLEGGELLLTTGMRMPATDDVALAEYVERLAEVGVSALGLAVGITHDATPPGLIAAADKAGVTLLEVPVPTPFIAVSKAVSALLRAEELEAITRAFEAQRDLTRAALSGPGAVASRLARHVHGWVLVLGADGAVEHAASAVSGGPSAADDVADLPDELVALRGRGLLASSSLSGPSGCTTLQPLGARGRVRGFLAVGTTEPLDRTAQSVVAVAVSLLSVALEGGGPQERVVEGVQAATIRLLLAGTDPDLLPLSDLGWSWLRESSLRVVALRSSAGDDAVPASLLAPLLDQFAASDVLGAAGGDAALVVRDEPLVLARLGKAVAGAGLRGGGSVGTPIGGLAVGLGQAKAGLQAGSAAHAGARHQAGVRWYGELAAEGMLGALDHESASLVADAMLAPLDGRKGDLVRSLAAWLARHGQWDAAAADLGVHRHTLRYRMRRVEELLGRSLDDPDLRAELWLALRVRGVS